MLDLKFIPAQYVEYAIKLAIEFAPKFILALLSLLIGLWVIGKVGKTFKKIAILKDWDPSLIPFVGGLIAVTLKVVLFISVASLIGIQTTSFVAVLGAASLAIGLALQGSLSNFAGGVLILILKPYKVGDVIETGGHVGEVTEIQIFNTILLTGDGKTVILPNGSVSNGTIVNYNKRGKRRIDMVIKLNYTDNHELAMDLIRDLLSTYPEILKDPAPIIEILDLTNHTVDICIRPTVLASDYWPTHFKVMKGIKQLLLQHQFQLPIVQYERSVS
jgi:small conductance mechanosensitive channel